MTDDDMILLRSCRPATPKTTTSTPTEGNLVSDKRPSPSSVANRVNSTSAKYDRDLRKAEQEGFNRGLAKGRQEIIEWLQAAYLGPNAPDRGSVEGKAILELARQASDHFLRPNQKRGRRR